MRHQRIHDQVGHVERFGEDDDQRDQRHQEQEAADQGRSNKLENGFHPEGH